MSGEDIGTSSNFIEALIHPPTAELKTENKAH
jgi:hypothetical protein